MDSGSGSNNSNSLDSDFFFVWNTGSILKNILKNNSVNMHASKTRISNFMQIHIQTHTHTFFDRMCAFWIYFINNILYFMRPLSTHTKILEIYRLQKVWKF